MIMKDAYLWKNGVPVPYENQTQNAIDHLNRNYGKGSVTNFTYGENRQTLMVHCRLQYGTRIYKARLIGKASVMMHGRQISIYDERL